MRSGLCCVVILLVAGVCAFADDSLVGYWPLDGNADDLSGFGRNGVAVNGPVWASDGYISGCVSLDGVDDYIEIGGYTGIAGGASRTCMAWINTSNTAWWNDIVGWGSLATGQRWLVTVSQSGFVTVAVVGGYQQGQTTVNDGRWHHVAVVLNDDGSPVTGEIEIYIDGVKETACTTVSQTINTAQDAPVRIGLFQDSLDRYFQGRIDDVRIYDRALTASEVLGAFRGLTQGSGTAEDPYQISTQQQLMAIGSNIDLLDKHYILMNDIVFDPNNNPAHVFSQALIAPDPDYSRSPAFSGSFDGNGHRIVNLTILNGSYNVGLFGNLIGTDVSQVLVHDLTFVNPQIGGIHNSGALAGRTENCTVESCHVIGGTISYATGNWMGGLVGSNDYAILRDCSSSATISGNQGLGGLVGATNSATIIHCSASGNVTGNDQYVGGLVGYMAAAYFEDYSTAGDRIVDSYATGDVNAMNGACGGLVGIVCKGLIQRCYATGWVSGGDSLGGLIGLVERELYQSTFSLYGEVDIDGCYAIGDVSSESGSYIGGLIGSCSAFQVKDCYARGNVSAASGSYAGGLIGTYANAVVRCYASGTVSGTDPTGGLIGGDGFSFLSYWDTESSGLPTSNGGVSKTTEQMMSRQTYRGWGDAVWVLDEGQDYPHLAWENTTGELIVDEKPYSGTGTVNDPYCIKTIDDLIMAGFYTQDWVKEFELTDDLVLDPADLNDPNVVYTNANFNKFGFSGLPFGGHFNGNFHSISNLRNRNVNAVCNGLFGSIRGDGPDDVVVENLIVVNPAFAGISNNGGLAGQLESGKVVRCGVENVTLTRMSDGIYGEGSNVGGLIGHVKDATISACFTEGILNPGGVHVWSWGGALAIQATALFRTVMR